MQTRFNLKNKNKFAITTIEIIISIGLFSIILVALTASLLSVMALGVETRNIKVMMNEIDFALEQMVRNIRTGSDYDCYPGDVQTNCPSVGQSNLSLRDQYGRTIYYRLNNGVIETKINNNSYTPLTSPEINITRLLFYVSGQGVSNEQSTVLILVGGEAEFRNQKTNFNIETLATQRFFNK